MTRFPKHDTTSEKAIDLLGDGKPLIDLYIEGDLSIETDKTWDKKVVLENCIVEFFSGNATQFVKPVRFINCHFKNCKFIFTYFLGGLTIKNCTFDTYLAFQAGGHNQAGNLIAITDNEFKGFVNFFDCWFESETVISKNRFHQGTNLLGKPNNISVTFDKKPIIDDNLGQLDLDDEGIEV